MLTVRFKTWRNPKKPLRQQDKQVQDNLYFNFLYMKEVVEKIMQELEGLDTEDKLDAITEIISGLDVEWNNLYINSGLKQEWMDEQEQTVYEYDMWKEELAHS
jgi:hypothetical protein